jgi:hypothetical protein
VNNSECFLLAINRRDCHKAGRDQKVIKSAAIPFGIVLFSASGSKVTA